MHSDRGRASPSAGRKHASSPPCGCPTRHPTSRIRSTHLHSCGEDGLCPLAAGDSPGAPAVPPRRSRNARTAIVPLPVCSWFFQAEDGIRDYKVTGVQTCALLIQAEDGIRDYKVTGVQTCALPIQAEDGIRDYKVTGVQTCALPIQAEDGIRDYKVTGVQTCALPI